MRCGVRGSGLWPWRWSWEPTMHDRGPPSGTLTKTFCELERSGLMRLPEACLLVALLENTKESLSHHLTATLSPLKSPGLWYSLWAVSESLILFSRATEAQDPAVGKETCFLQSPLNLDSFCLKVNTSIRVECLPFPLYNSFGQAISSPRSRRQTVENLVLFSDLDQKWSWGK